MNLIEGTLEQAIDALAQREVELRSRPATPLEKLASLSDILTSVGSSLRENPTLGHALLGSGVGALAGGGATMMGNAMRPPEKRRSVLGGAMTGGLAGGAIGGGASLAAKGLSNINGGGQGLQHGDALQPGMFTDPETGKMMRIDPQTLRANPDLAAKVKALSQPVSPGEQTARGIIGGGLNLASNALPFGNSLLNSTGAGGGGDTWLDRNLPTSTNIVPKAMTLDALLHSKLNLGERIGLGRIRPQFSKSVDNLRAGVKDLYDKDHPIRQEIESGTKPKPGTAVGARGQSAAEQIGNSRLSDPGKGRMNWLQRLLGNHGRGDDKVMRAGGETLDRARAWQAKDVGYAANEAMHGRKDNPRDLFNFFGRDRQVASRPVRILGRAALYSSIPAAEYLIRGQMDENANKDKLRELMQQYAKPVPAGK